VGSDTDKATLIGTLDRPFPWGLLVVSDEGASDVIPPWQSEEEQVTSTATTVVARVEHEQEASALIHVYMGAGDLPGPPVFSGAVTTRAGVLTVGDALGDSVIRVPGLARSLRLDVFLDRPVNATHVDIVIDGGPT
jgi:hypothetical protein